MGGLLVVARLHVGTLDAAEGSLSMKVFEKSETRWVEKNAVLKGPFCRKKAQSLIGFYYVICPLVLLGSVTLY